MVSTPGASICGADRGLSPRLLGRAALLARSSTTRESRPYRSGNGVQNNAIGFLGDARYPRDWIYRSVRSFFDPHS